MSASGRVQDGRSAILGRIGAALDGAGSKASRAARTGERLAAHRANLIPARGKPRSGGAG